MDLSGPDFQGFLKGLMANGKEPGRKLCDLDIDDVAALAAMNQKAEEISKRQAELDMDKKELMFQSDSWWMRVRKKYKLKASNMTIVDGNTIHELVDKNKEPF